MALSFRFFFSGFARLLLLFAVVAVTNDAPKPGEATVTAVSAPAAVPRSTSTDSGRSVAEARPVGARSGFARSVDMLQWLGQVESEFGRVRNEMQVASSKTDALSAGNQDSESTYEAQCAHLARGEPGRPGGRFSRQPRRAGAADAEVAAPWRCHSSEIVGPITGLDSPGPYPPSSRGFSGRHLSLRGGVDQRYGTRCRPASRL